MGYRDQFAKELWTDEIEPLFGSAIHWQTPVEISLVSVLLDGLLEVVDPSALQGLPAPWSLLESLRFVVVDFKMQGDHVDVEAWNLALQRRQAMVVQLHKQEQHDETGAVTLWIVHARLPTWLETSALRVGLGCYEVETVHGAGLWIAANELPLHPALIPFLVASDGEPMMRFARWVIDQRPTEWVKNLLSSLPMTEAQKIELLRRLPDPNDPGLLEAQKTVTFIALDQLSRLAPSSLAEVLQSVPLEQRLAGVDAAHAVLALPVEVLRGLSAEYLATLPQDVQDEVRRRLAV